MRELDGRSYSEIAETLGVTVPAVETLIFRARRRLRADRSLKVLGAVQLPPSLTSFFESGGGAVAGGGILVGSGLIGKAAIAILAGVMAGTVGYKTVNATIFKPHGHLTALRQPERLLVFPAASDRAQPTHARARAGKPAVAGRELAPVVHATPKHRRGPDVDGDALPATGHGDQTLPAEGVVDSGAASATPAPAAGSPGGQPQAKTGGPSSRPVTPPALPSVVPEPVKVPVPPVAVPVPPVVPPLVATVTTAVGGAIPPVVPPVPPAPPPLPGIR
jgi:hypothetical protein